MKAKNKDVQLSLTMNHGNTPEGLFNLLTYLLTYLATYVYVGARLIFGARSPMLQGGNGTLGCHLVRPMSKLQPNRLTASAD